MPFSPTDLSNLYPWFKADALGLANNDPVTTWTDSSGLGKDAIQNSVNKKPTFKTGIFAGATMPAVLFDGTDDGMSTTLFATAMTQPITVFAVAKAQVNDTTQRHLTDGVSSTQRNVIFDGGTSSTNWRYYAGGSLVTGDARDTNLHVFSALFNGASSILRKDGVQIATGNPGTQALTGLAIGDSNLGAGGAGNYWHGYVCEIVLYNADHSASFADVEGYLTTRWTVAAAGGRPPRYRRRPTAGLVYR